MGNFLSRGRLDWCLWWLSLSSLAAGQEADISGTYQAEGGGGDGVAYTGSVVIEKKAHAYEVSWVTGESNDKVLGVGLRRGQVLSVAFHTEGTEDSEGIAVFLIHPDGRLTGRWALVGLPETVFEERLAPAESAKKGSPFGAGLGAVTQALGQVVPQTVEIVGDYEVKGLSDVSETYTGTASISRNEKVFEVRWVTGESQHVYLGTGLRTGDLLSVAFRSESDESIHGVMVYKISEGPELNGEWTMSGFEGAPMTEKLTSAGAR